MAEVFYNDMTGTHDAYSAGVEVDMPGKNLAQRQEVFGVKSNTVIVMEEIGFDLSQNKQKILTQDMLQDYDTVISMCDESIAPEWLKSAPNYAYWDIKDPVGSDVSFFRETRDRIKSLVRRFIEQR